MALALVRNVSKKALRAEISEGGAETPSVQADKSNAAIRAQPVPHRSFIGALP